MTKRLRLSLLPKAEEDIVDIAAHIAGNNPCAAARFVDAFGYACDLLADMPEIGSPRTFRHPDLEGLRSWGIKGFEKYLIFYRVAGAVLEVIRVLHGARDLPALFGETEE